MTQKIVVLIAACSFLSAPALAQTSQTSRSKLSNLLRQSSIQSEVSAGTASGEIRNEGFEAFMIEPSVSAEAARIKMKATLPITWYNGSDNDETDNIRTFGRPELQGLYPVYSSVDTKVDAGAEVKMPIYNSSHEALDLNNGLALRPLAKATIALPDSVDLLGEGSLEITDTTEENGIEYERAPLFRFVGGAEKAYDRKLMFGSKLIYSKTFNDNKLKARGLGTFSSAPRENIAISLYSQFKLNSQHTIQAKLTSSLRDNDEDANVLLAYDELDESSQLAASVGLISRW
jgi:hypothetical protein